MKLHKLLQGANALNMSTHLQDNAQDVQPDSFQVTLLEDSKMVPVIELIKIALVKVKYS